VKLKIFYVKNKKAGKLGELRRSNAPRVVRSHSSAYSPKLSSKDVISTKLPCHFFFQNTVFSFQTSKIKRERLN
jgi:hypothetical protein